MHLTNPKLRDQSSGLSEEEITLLEDLDFRITFKAPKPGNVCENSMPRIDCRPTVNNGWLLSKGLAPHYYSMLALRYWKQYVATERCEMYPLIADTYSQQTLAWLFSICRNRSLKSADRKAILEIANTVIWLTVYADKTEGWRKTIDVDIKALKTIESVKGTERIVHLMQSDAYMFKTIYTGLETDCPAISVAREITRGLAAVAS